MNSLPVHKQTKFFIGHFVANPKQSLLLHGKPGSGKKVLAHEIAAELLGTKPNTLQKHPYVLVIDPQDPTISIENIRSLQQFLKLKVPGKQKQVINRVILILGAERMRQEAQNALLKTLEEPPTHTCMILTANNPKSLLPTITSRTHLLEVLPIDLQTALQAYADKDPATVQKFHALSQGQAELLHSLLTDSHHPLLDQINSAKQILSEKKGRRLFRTDELAKDKVAVRQLLEALLRISHAGLAAAASKNALAQLEQWLGRQEAILQSLQQLDQNTQAKLVLDNLFLEI